MEESKPLDVSRTNEYTVAEWPRLWFELYSKSHVRPSTADYYRRSIEQYTIPRIGSIKLKKLTGRDIQKLYKDLQENGRERAIQKKTNPGLSSSTIRETHRMLHLALDRSMKERLILRNPAEDCIVPKLEKQEMKILPPEDMKAYLNAAEKHGVLAMFYLELVTGIRKGELTTLLWSDLNIERRTISVSKQAGWNGEGELEIRRPKTENSIREISIPPDGRRSPA